MDFKPSFSESGIGSLPFDYAAYSVDFILDTCPQIPYWAQLPKISSKESMVEQYSEELPGLKTMDNMFVDLEDPDLGQKLELFYADYADGNFEKYAISEEYASGLYEFAGRGKLDVLAAKGQVTGPVSFGLSLKDQAGKYVIYNDLYRDVYIKALSLKLKFVESMLQKISTRTILVIDEPLLYTFGSAYFNMERSIIVDAMKDTLSLVSGIKGVHACENCDWSLIFDAEADLISFDAYSFMDKFLIFKDRIKSLIDSGGIIAWGIVPNTDELYRQRTASELSDILKRAFEELENYGIDITALAQQSMITPGCGVGTLSNEDAKYVFDLNSQIASIMKDNYV